MLELFSFELEALSSLTAAEAAAVASFGQGERAARGRLRQLGVQALDDLHLGGAARASLRFLKRLARRARKAVNARTSWFWTPLVPAEQFFECSRNAIRVLRDGGPELQINNYLEFGVSRGTSLACMFHALQSERLTGVRLIGFDSFQGLPPEAAQEGWSPGSFWSTRSATERYLRQHGVDPRRVVLVEGWFKETLKPSTRDRLALESASLIMIDCDIYSASRDALWFCEPLIRSRAVIFFDDWGRRLGEGQIGQREAFRDFLAEFPDLKAEPLPAYIPEARVFLVSRPGR